ncbi:MAG: hypothetical protein OMM_08127 [Candidatus Magnetoglobus multicellularis str. Araruama]|uniref:Uncharacterized protein n=1 Tax=Candidatus Magnetoglobus multicellularis str. Araruama TaxID=890399 RepID=A0A1V1P9G5_9BACT|nr:MAG: hypothetical protein OMM_08127 [Candidatus Magnetoglobus multicellularis str. Araruama]
MNPLTAVIGLKFNKAQRKEQNTLKSAVELNVINKYEIRKLNLRATALAKCEQLFSAALSKVSPELSIDFYRQFIRH